MTALPRAPALNKPRTPRLGHRPRPGPGRTGHHGRARQHRDKCGQNRARTVGHYLMGRTLGEGSFGKVRLGTHILTGEKVAVKILEKSRLVEAADVQRVAREIKILKRNRHRNIIQLFEVLDTPTAIYLIMENADAGEMFNYIVQHKRVDEIEACRFFHQIMDGAEYLHEMEVTHRDLKPENLLLQNSKQGLLVKIVDFGLSNTHDGGSLLQTACGSPCYAAPEMIAGLKYWGPKADIWSMGVILYALVCGYLPFEDSNTSILYKKIMSGIYSCPNWISPDVRDLISHILATDPVQRYSICDIRGHRWFSHVSTPQLHMQAELEPQAVESPDPAVLGEIESIGIHRATVEDALKRGLHNNATTTYHLLCKRMMRNAEHAAITSRPGTSCVPHQHQATHALVGTYAPLCASVIPVPKLRLPASVNSCSAYDADTTVAVAVQPDTSQTVAASYAHKRGSRASTSRSATTRPASVGTNVHVSQTARLDAPGPGAPQQRTRSVPVASPAEAPLQMPPSALHQPIRSQWPPFASGQEDFQQQLGSPSKVRFNKCNPQTQISCRKQKSDFVAAVHITPAKGSSAGKSAMQHRPRRPDSRYRRNEGHASRRSTLASNLATR